jgi:G patch domain/KOW motif-containing protein
VNAIPLILRYRNPALDGVTDEKKKFDIDVATRPKEMSLETYEQIPVADFGVAALRGMGWTPGSAIGLTNKKVIEPIEFVKRAQNRAGLGAKVAMEEPHEKKYIKPGESREVQVRMNFFI